MKSYNVKLNIYATYNCEVKAKNEGEAQLIARQKFDIELENNGIQEYDIEATIKEVKTK